jgi:hypothetical protein
VDNEEEASMRNLQAPSAAKAPTKAEVGEAKETGAGADVGLKRPVERRGKKGKKAGGPGGNCLAFPRCDSRGKKTFLCHYKGNDTYETLCVSLKGSRNGHLKRHEKDYCGQCVVPVPGGGTGGGGAGGTFNCDSTGKKMSVCHYKGAGTYETLCVSVQGAFKGHYKSHFNDYPGECVVP